MPSPSHLATGEPAFGWCFMAIFPMLSSVTPLYVATATLPDVTWEPAETHYFASKVKLASKATVNDCTLVIKDYVDPNVAAIAWAWYNAVGSNADGYVNAPGSYKTDGTLLITDGRGNPVNTFNLRGCYPSGMQFGDGDYGNSDIMQISLTISVDAVTLNS